MKPENVKSKNFKVEHIIYNVDKFSIAYGVWQNDIGKHIAMRWNGVDNKNGYPIGNWFLVSSDLTNIFLTALLSSPDSDKDFINSILKK